MQKEPKTAPNKVRELRLNAAERLVRQGKEAAIEKFALEAGISVVYWRAIERGKFSPSYRVKKSISKVLGSTVENVFGEDAAFE